MSELQQTPVHIVNWTNPRNMDTGLSEVMVFKLFRSETATPTVPSPAFVIALDIIKHRCPYYCPADKMFSMDRCHFQRMKEAFHAGIIVAAALSAHTATQIIPLQQRLIICWTVPVSTDAFWLSTRYLSAVDLPILLSKQCVDLACDITFQAA